MTTKSIPIAAAIAVGLALGGCTSGDPQSLVPVTAGAPIRVALAPAAPVGGSVAVPRNVPSQAYLPAGPAASRLPDVSVRSAALAPPAGAARQVSAGPVASTPVDPALATTRIDLAPITGAPANKVTALSRSIAARGREVGLGLGGTPTHRLKGYFSVNDDGSEIRVVYIWDVIDASGRRVHRIQGQERIARTTRGDAWGAVGDDAMALIGRKTVDSFTSWRRKA